jgi:hypothetical protein
LNDTKYNNTQKNDKYNYNNSKNLNNISSGKEEKNKNKYKDM